MQLIRKIHESSCEIEECDEVSRAGRGGSRSGKEVAFSLWQLAVSFWLATDYCPTTTPTTQNGVNLPGSSGGSNKGLLLSVI